MDNIVLRTGNLLLDGLDASHPLHRDGGLERVELTQGSFLERADQPVEDVYFPVSGLVSVVATGPEGHSVEAGLVGCEGLTGHMLLLGGTQSVHDMVVQIPGESWRLKASALQAALRRDEVLRDRLLRYMQSVMIQLSHSALAYGRAVIEIRLARWLLMCRDRVGQDDLALTHEFLALMLGVRRSGVTVALHKLEGLQMVRSMRGRVVIRDRAGLEEMARGFYGAPEAHYERLLGVPLRC